jgi:hypothetical protein
MSSSEKESIYLKKFFRVSRLESAVEKTTSDSTSVRYNKYRFVEDGDSCLKNCLHNSGVKEFEKKLPPKVLCRREAKWIEMLDNYDEWIKLRFDKVKSRCRKGIPALLRPKAWMHLSGARLSKDKSPKYNATCLENKSSVDIAKAVVKSKRTCIDNFPATSYL